MKTIKLELTVIIPDDDNETNVENSINEALDEPPCDWGTWTVGRATVTSKRWSRD